MLGHFDRGALGCCGDTFARPVRSLLLGLVMAGCSDGDAVPSEADPTLVTIQTGKPPALLAFRDEVSTEWQVLTDAGASTFEAVPTGPYRVVVACESTNSWVFVEITEYARTPEDGASIEHPCRSADYPFVVRGQLLHPGQVALGEDFQGHVGSSWYFELQAAVGAFDLVLLSGDFNVGFDRLAIRRDLVIAEDTLLGSIDLSQENTEALVPTQFTAPNLRAGESRSSKTLLHTGSTVVPLQDSSFDQRSDWNTRLAPEHALRPTDRQTVSLSAVETSAGAISQQRHRSVTRELRVGDPTSVTLPEPLGPVTFEMSTDRLTAVWSTLPEHDEVSLRRESVSADYSRRWYHQITLSRSFIAATGAARITLDLGDVPNFKSAWRHDPALDQVRAFAASRGAPGDRASSGVNQRIASPL